MYIYFDKLGVLREIINDGAIRLGDDNSDTIHAYIEDLPTLKGLSIVIQRPDGTITNEEFMTLNRTGQEIPYDKNRDLKYFEDYKEYQFYEYKLSSAILNQDGLFVATIKTLDDDNIKVQGLITFNVENGVVKSSHEITQSQFDYLLEQIGIVKVAYIRNITFDKGSYIIKAYDQDKNEITIDLGQIKTNKANIESNLNKINDNTSKINTNLNKINANADKIKVNENNISKNTSDIAENKQNIANNRRNITTNTSNIESNTNAVNSLKSTKIDKKDKGVPNGVATLDNDGKVPSNQLPSYVDDVIEGTLKDTSHFLGSDEITYTGSEASGKIFIDIRTNKQYRWGGTQFVKITSGEGVVINDDTLAPEQAYKIKVGDKNYTIVGSELAFSDQEKAGTPLKSITLKDLATGELITFKIEAGGDKVIVNSGDLSGETLTDITVNNVPYALNYLSNEWINIFRNEDKNVTSLQLGRIGADHSKKFYYAITLGIDTVLTFGDQAKPLRLTTSEDRINVLANLKTKQLAYLDDLKNCLSSYNMEIVSQIDNENQIWYWGGIDIPISKESVADEFFKRYRTKYGASFTLGNDLNGLSFVAHDRPSIRIGEVIHEEMAFLSDIENERTKVVPLTTSQTTIQNNTIYRATNLASINLIMPFVSEEQKATYDFDAEIQLTITTNPPEITTDDGVISWQGDDITDGAWTPKQNTRYVVHFFYDGVNYVALSKNTQKA